LGRARIVRSIAAKTDLAEIWSYLAERSPRAADRLLKEIEQQIERLAEFPEIGPQRPEIGTGARVLTIGNYIVLYRFDGETVAIMRVVHGARDLGELL
jgi:toxin ParE1/3/4